MAGQTMGARDQGYLQMTKNRKRPTYQYVGPSKSKRPLRIGPKKALWMMRMVRGEGGRHCSKRKAVVLCWAIVNRWFLWPGARHYMTFVGMMRRFSQPINPRWMTGGDLARKFAGRDSTSAARLKRRARCCAMTLDDIPMRIRYAVEMFAEGLTKVTVHDTNKGRLSNWASLPSTPTRYPWGIDVDGDWFFEDANLRPGSVEIVKANTNG